MSALVLITSDFQIHVVSPWSETKIKSCIVHKRRKNRSNSDDNLIKIKKKKKKKTFHMCPHNKTPQAMI